jgi:mono/diheme cytochrome c family protein
MNEDNKKQIKERYQRELNKGELFWPDSIFKDAIVALGILILLILLATFVGVAGEPKADPSDTSYIPRPEWYFLFLFKFLALYGQIPVIGKIEWLATVLVPSIGIGLILFLPFIDKNRDRYYAKRAMPLGIMAIMVVNMIILTLISDIPTVAPDGAGLIVQLSASLQPYVGLIIPGFVIVALLILSQFFKGTSWRLIAWITGAGSVLMIALTIAILNFAPAVEVTETTVATTLVEQIFAGQDLYSINCVECHGDDGKVTLIEGVEGLEGKIISPINGHDVLYTLNDATMAEVIAYGRPEAGMNPFGKMYNPEGLSKSDIDNIVIFMRYMWDDRFEIPAEALKPLFPPLAEGEVPSYDVHIAPIVKRYCISCHRAGKDNNDFLMTTYDEIITTGENVDNDIIAGSLDSYLLQVIQEHAIMDPANPTEELIGVMPPNTVLKPNVVDAFIRWIMNGMPRTAEDAAALFVAPTPVATPVSDGTPAPAVTPTP